MLELTSAAAPDEESCDCDACCWGPAFASAGRFVFTGVEWLTTGASKGSSQRVDAGRRGSALAYADEDAEADAEVGTDEWTRHAITAIGSLAAPAAGAAEGHASVAVGEQNVRGTEESCAGSDCSSGSLVESDSDGVNVSAVAARALTLRGTVFARGADVDGLM